MPFYINLINILVNFPMQILAAQLMCTPLYKHRRKYFALRLTLCTVVYFVIAYFLMNTVVGQYFMIWKNISTVYLIIVILSALLLFACFDITGWNVMFYALFALSIQHISYNIHTIVMVSAKLDFYSVISPILSVVFCAAVYTAGYFLFVKRLIKDKDVEIDNKVFISLLLVVYTSFIFLNQWIEMSGYNWGYRIYSLIICFVTLSLQFGLLGRDRLKRQTNQLQLILQKEKEQKDLSQNTIDILNVKLHDMKQQLNSIREIIGEEKYKSLFDECAKSISVFEAIAKTGNKALDTVFTEKALLCEKHNIKLSIIADGNSLSFMNDEDIYSLIGNMFTNAIESLVKIADDEKKLISLNINKHNNIVFIHMENYYESDLSYKNGLPITTKSDSRYHGFGMKSISYIVEKYGGTMVLDTENNMFKINITLVN